MSSQRGLDVLHFFFDREMHCVVLSQRSHVVLSRGILVTIPISFDILVCQSLEHFSGSLTAFRWYCIWFESTSPLLWKASRHWDTDL